MQPDTDIRLQPLGAYPGLATARDTDAARLLAMLTGSDAFGTVAFGLQGVFESVFGITEFRSLATFDIYPLPVAIVLILAGPLFPVALLSLGAMHWWTGLTPRWSAVLLVFAAAAFPVARISRSVPVAFIADLVMLAAFCVVAWFAWHRRDEKSI